MAAPQTPGFVGGNAGLLGVEQDPTNPNKYVATFANGNVIPLTGAAGKNLYDRQQAVKQLSAPAPVAAPAQRERVGTTTVEAPQKIVGGLPPDESAATAPAQQQQSGPQSLGQTLEATDPATGKKFTGEAFRMPDGTVRVMRQGTAGSPGGLTSLGKQTMQQYGEAQTLAAQHSAEAAKYQQMGVQLAVKDAQAQQAYLEEQKVQAMLEARDAAEEEAAIQKRVAGLEANYEKARQEFASAKVDPNRFVKESPGGGWLLGLSAALGAFGAGMARTPNFAMEFINGRIADDIRAQESAINVKGRDADNQLATLTRSLGDLSLAKKAYRQIKLEEASVEAQRITNQYKGQQIAANAMMVAEQSAAEGIRAGEEKSRAFVEHVMKDKLYFRQGSAGTPGGFYLTGTNELQGRKNLEQVDDPKSKSAAEAANRAVPAERTDAVRSAASAIDAANSVESNLRSRGFSEDSTVDDPLSGGLDAIARGGSALVGGDLAKEDSALKAQTFAMARGLQKALGKSDNDANLAAQQAGEGESAATRLQQAKLAREQAIRTARSELATLQPNQQEALLSTMSPEARKAVLGEK